MLYPETSSKDKFTFSKPFRNDNMNLELTFAYLLTMGLNELTVALVVTVSSSTCCRMDSIDGRETYI